MLELAYLNGVFLPIPDAKVSIEDRGFQFGDGVYEVLAVYGGQPFLLPEHLARLRRSIDGIDLVYDLDAHPLEPVIEEGVRRSGFHDTMVYIQLTRGAASRSHTIPRNVTPTVIMTFKALPTVPEDLRARGARVMTTPEIRWTKCYIKAITLLPNILAKHDAQARGCDEAIFVTESGEVRECTSSNVFIVDHGRLVIPPRTESILHGVTQGFLLDCAAGIGIEAEERAFDVDALRRAEEVFITSTAVEVLAVTTVDDHAIGLGRPGPIQERLYREFRQRSRPA